MCWRLPESSFAEKGRGGGLLPETKVNLSRQRALATKADKDILSPIQRRAAWKRLQLGNVCDGSGAFRERVRATSVGSAKCSEKVSCNSLFRDLVARPQAGSTTRRRSLRGLANVFSLRPQVGSLRAPRARKLPEPRRH
ncbi:uncharacterized protein LOC127395203 isoform X8 [Apus apus]|uniref:uncharacterized protein LOC127395203 isoform X8 n=1 Tax=Apus apus TaxID=8895 RepID=UPI0021F911CB|nr:uncharacterized protein LOC127395203 isoform X8 [Apus apus]